MPTQLNLVRLMELAERQTLLGRARRQLLCAELVNLTLQKTQSTAKAKA